MGSGPKRAVPASRGAALERLACQRRPRRSRCSRHASSARSKRFAVRSPACPSCPSSPSRPRGVPPSEASANRVTWPASEAPASGSRPEPRPSASVARHSDLARLGGDSPAPLVNGRVIRLPPAESGSCFRGRCCARLRPAARTLELNLGWFEPRRSIMTRHRVASALVLAAWVGAPTAFGDFFQFNGTLTNGYSVQGVLQTKAGAPASFIESNPAFPNAPFATQFIESASLSVFLAGSEIASGTPVVGGISYEAYLYTAFDSSTLTLSALDLQARDPAPDRSRTTSSRTGSRPMRLWWRTGRRPSTCSSSIPATRTTPTSARPARWR